MERAYERVVSELMDEIVTGRAAAGDRLPRVADIATERACTRSAALQAVRALEERNVVAVHAGRGREILDSDRWKLLDKDVAEAALLRHGDRRLMREAVDFLAMFEPRAAMLAAPRARKGNLRLLSETIDLMRHSSRGGNGAENRDDQFAQAEADFHRTLLQMAGNRFLASAFEYLHPVLAQARRQRAADRDPSVIRLHESIVVALKERDATAAAAAVEDYAKHLASWLA